LGIAAKCWIVHETLKQEHTIQNHNTPVTQNIQWFSWFEPHYVKFFKQ